MFSRTPLALGLVLMMSLIFTLPVFAGGWAVITLDELPTNVKAGESFTVGFTVLQHGKTPMTGLYPTITIILSKDEHFVVNAEPEGKPGHYTATLNIPKEGDWEWSIQAFTMDQPMPVLSVTAPVAGAASQTVVNSEPVSTSISLISIVRVSALGVGLAGLVFVFRRKSRLAVAWTVLSLLVALGSFISVAVVPAVEARSKSSSEVINDSSISKVELGRQLFVAKGCITCHMNNKLTSNSDYWTIDMGAPNLTSFSASPEALRLRLNDPSSVKSDTQMPNLNLADNEIEALITFINSE